MKDFFDRLSLVYDKIVITQFYSGHTAVFNAVVSSGLDFEKLKVLDVGTGTGLLAQNIKRAWPMSDITGVDISSAMLEKAAKREVLDKACQLDIHKGLPFKDGEFDLVVSSGMFEFIRTPESCISEMARVTKRGGFIALTTLGEQGRMAKLSYSLLKAQLTLMGKQDSITLSQQYPSSRIIKAFDDAYIKVEGQGGGDEFLAYDMDSSSSFSRVNYKLFYGRRL